MKMSKKKLSMVFIVIIIFISLIGLDYLVNWNSYDDPTKRKRDIATNLIDKQAEQVELSEDVFYQDDQFVYYNDRIINRFNYKEENIKNIAIAWENLSRQFPQDVNSFIVPIPARIIFEKGYEEDKLKYDEFYQKLEKNFLALALVVDFRDTFDIHKEEYIFHRTSNSITARGAYYASKQIGNILGSDFYIPLDEYHEHMYREYIGELYISNQMKFNKGSKEYNLFEDIPNDLTYYYLLAESNNICEVFRLDENLKISSSKQPTIIKSGTGSGSMISSSRFEWAIVEGDGKALDKKDETLLFISDTSGRYMLPYLANYYKDVYYINLEWNKILGSDLQRLEEIFERYQINDIVYAQNAYEMGDFAYSRSIKRFFMQEVK